MSGIFGISFTEQTIEELASELTQDHAQGPVRHQHKAAALSENPFGPVKTVITANLDHIVNLKNNSDFRAAYRAAWRVTIDGAPVYLWARLRRQRHFHRITGADLTPLVFKRLVPDTHRVFFVTASWNCAQALTEYFLDKGFSRNQIGCHVPPFGFENDAEQSRLLAEKIRKHQPSHIFFGLGAPKSEVWLNGHRDQLGGAYALCVGAALEFVVGQKKRAPMWMRRYGFEWVWRLLCEPGRLSRRYLVNSWQFLKVIFDDARGRTLI